MEQSVEEVGPPNRVYGYHRDYVMRSNPDLFGSIELKDAALQALFPPLAVHLLVVRGILGAYGIEGTNTSYSDIQRAVRTAQNYRAADSLLVLFEDDIIYIYEPYRLVNLSRDEEEALRRRVCSVIWTSRKYGGHIQLIDALYAKYGFSYDGYFNYINPNHPFYLAISGSFQLTPQVFELCNGPWSVLEGETMSDSTRKALSDAITSIRPVDPQAAQVKYNQIVTAFHNEPELYPEAESTFGERLMDSIKEDVLSTGLDEDALSALDTALNACSRSQSIGPVLPAGPLGWSKKQLIDAILETGLNTVGKRLPATGPTTADVDVLRGILTLDIITGQQVHRGIPLPGLGIPLLTVNPLMQMVSFYREIENYAVQLGYTYSAFNDQQLGLYDTSRYNLNAVFNWHKKTCSPSYYKLVYRRVYDSMRYYDYRPLCKSTVPLGVIRRIADLMYGFNQTTVTNFQILNKEELCAMLKGEKERAAAIRTDIVESIVPDTASSLILQPGSVWLMDAVGTIHLFKEGAGTFTPQPDDILPEDLTSLKALYSEMCVNNDRYSIGAFVHIVEALGARGVLPANLSTLSKEELCKIINQRLTGSQMLSTMTFRELPLEYTPYVSMCENKDKYSLQEFMQVVATLGLESQVKSRLCSWMLSLDVQPNIKGRLVNQCGNREQVSLSVMVNVAGGFDRDGTMIKDMICSTVSTYLRTMKVG